eukprot:scaffold5772_cov105-Isochrysis_galbana.AAC.7
MRYHHTNGPQPRDGPARPCSHGRSIGDRGALLGHWPEGSWRRDSVGRATERQTTRSGKRSMTDAYMGTLSAAMAPWHMASTAARHKGGRMSNRRLYT